MPTRSLMRVRPLSEDAPSLAPRGLSSRHFLKLVEDTGEVGFWSAGPRGDRLEASVGLIRILGLDPAAEIAIDALLDMIHPEDQSAHGDQFALLRSGQPVTREFRVVRPDRTQRWVRHRAEVLLGPDGKPAQAMGVMFDVTDCYDAMRAVRQRHDRLNALVAATAAVFWINGPDGEPREMPQWQALTGQSHADMAGEGWLDAVHPDDRARTAAAWMTAVAHAAPYNTDYRLLCADGVYRWFNARGAPMMNRDGSVREWVGVCLSVPGRNRYVPSRPEPASAAGRVGPDLPNPTAAQVRAARGMACLSKEELAKRANVSISTVVRLEDGNSAVRPRPETVTAVRRALEQSGVAFVLDAEGRPALREA
ncbi:PAS domain-containing protein [Methylobacterium dankookense]|uniref:histidine kinase n=1 Tax=Methylobacterium dankookense TaxID=560405 RepID=A0A564G1A2_9HYPH|nr:PAS domain-containing protein [Methylobacterium dankookense]GJD55594.1 hypothetical protein IFDJLNFL_1481 [Methylobacterium dankookense]VUF13806.1 Blue-light-activated histidine kinase [Methylobacterium dankookense]